MNIYVAHSNKFDYTTKLYEPIKMPKFYQNITSFCLMTK